jgi:hypothetical protein
MSKMKQVVIDNQKGVVMVEGKQIPRLLLLMIRGVMGKCFVVKHYRGKNKKGREIVVTRYPDMSGIVASERQRETRNLFKEAVVYAKWIVEGEERKKAFRKTLPRRKRKHVYQAAIRMYINMQGNAGWLRKQLAVRGMLSSGRREKVEKCTVGDQQAVWMAWRQGQQEVGFEVVGCKQQHEIWIKELQI